MPDHQAPRHQLSGSTERAAVLELSVTDPRWIGTSGRARRTTRAAVRASRACGAARNEQATQPGRPARPAPRVERPRTGVVQNVPTHMTVEYGRTTSARNDTHHGRPNSRSSGRPMKIGRRVTVITRPRAAGANNVTASRRAPLRSRPGSSPNRCAATPAGFHGSSGESTPTWESRAGGYSPASSKAHRGIRHIGPRPPSAATLVAVTVEVEKTARLPPRRMVRLLAVAALAGVAAVAIMFVLAVLVGRAAESACGGGWTSIEGELFPPSLRCVDASTAVAVVEDHSVTAWVIAIATTTATVLSLGVLVRFVVRAASPAVHKAPRR